MLKYVPKLIMKIQIASDLHIEWVHHRFPDAAGLTPAPGAELLILAGDIHAHDRALASFANWPVPVVYVAGNHEAYGAKLEGLLAHLHAQGPAHNIEFLEMRDLHLDGLRLLGCTLWTDYDLRGTAKVSMSFAQRSLRDHQVIASDAGLFTAAMARQRHIAARVWLESELSKPFDGKTVVVSHHGPHPAGVAPQFKGDWLNGAFFSDLRPLMKDVDLWVHGHTHSPVDIQEGRCRIVANPRGYPLNLREALDVEGLVFENPKFVPHFVLDI